MLILAPTRELAAQVEESVREYGKHCTSSARPIFGGVCINPQIDALKRGVDILVATPGRLLDHVGQRTVDLSKVEMLVLDEADRMLDMGFLPDMKRVLALLPKQRQTLLFSATFPDEIRALAATLLHSPASVAGDAAQLDSRGRRPEVHPRRNDRKSRAARAPDQGQPVVPGAGLHAHQARRQPPRRVARQARRHARSRSTATRARTRARARSRDFKRGDLQVLVATDIAARGLDIEQLPHVVNFDLPNVPEDYVHRIGRTGRAGADRRSDLAGQCAKSSRCCATSSG